MFIIYHLHHSFQIFLTPRQHCNWSVCLHYNMHRTFIPDRFEPLIFFSISMLCLLQFDSSLLSPNMEVPGDISVNPRSSSIISPIHIVQEQPYLLIITRNNQPHEHNTYFICLSVHVLSIHSYQAVVIAVNSVIPLLIPPIPRTKVSNPAESKLQNSKTQMLQMSYYRNYSCFHLLALRLMYSSYSVHWDMYQILIQYIYCTLEYSTPTKQGLVSNLLPELRL